MHSIMENHNLGQDVDNKRERKLAAAHIVAKFHPLYLAVKCTVMVHFITSPL